MPSKVQLAKAAKLLRDAENSPKPKSRKPVAGFENMRTRKIKSDSRDVGYEVIKLSMGKITVFHHRVKPFEGQTGLLAIGGISRFTWAGIEIDDEVIMANEDKLVRIEKIEVVAEETAPDAPNEEGEIVVENVEIVDGGEND